MLRKMALIIGTTLMIFTGFAQTTEVVGNPPEIRQITKLDALAGEVNASHDRVIRAASGSRSTAEEARAGYETALLAYAEALKLHLDSATGTTAEIIRQELILVERLLNPGEKSPTR